MRREAVTRVVAAHMPPYLRSLRARAALSPLCRAMGIEEVECPACGGSGWLNRRALRHCPLCCGFREVPDVVALWFEVQVRRCLNRTRSLSPSGMASYLFRQTPFRYGRTAEVLYKVSVEAADALF